MAKIGRPTKRTRELDEELLLHIAEGKTLRAFCREHKLSPTTIYSWLTEDNSLSGRLSRARLAGAWMLEDELQEIADTPLDPDDPDGDVAHRKLQCWAREKRLVWNNPGRYGSKVAIGGAVGLPPVQLTDTERVTRIQQLLDKASSVPRITVESVEEDDA